MDFICTQALKDWRTLNMFLASLTEAQLTAMIEFEKNNRRRGQLLKRMHQRFCKLRNEREWVELTNEINQ